MIRKIDPKYIKSAREHKGEVYFKYGEFRDRYENRVVEKPIPILGRIFPFLKRKKVERVVVGKDLFIQEQSEREIKLNGSDNAKKILESEKEKCPYSKICQLDPTIYGKGLYLAYTKDNVVPYQILTEDGVVLGGFTKYDHGEGYYSPNFNEESVRLPSGEEYNGGKAVALDDIVARYCAENPDTIEHIPEELYKKFPELASKLEQQISQELDADKSKTTKTTLTKE